MRDTPHSMRSVMIVMLVAIVVLVLPIMIIFLAHVAIIGKGRMRLMSELKVATTIACWETLRLHTLKHRLRVEREVERWLLRVEVLDTSKGRLEERISATTKVLNREGLAVLRSSIVAERWVSAWEGRQALEVVGQVWGARMLQG